MQKHTQNTTPVCYCLKIRRTAAVITNFYDKTLRSCGITARQYSLLFHISKKEHCSIRELADAVSLDRSTLARSLRPLYQYSFIVDIKESGARNSCLELTPSGRETLKQANQLWKRAQESVQQTLGADGIDGLDRTLSLLETLQPIKSPT